MEAVYPSWTHQLLVMDSVTFTLLSSAPGPEYWLSKSRLMQESHWFSPPTRRHLWMTMLVCFIRAIGAKIVGDNGWNFCSTLLLSTWPIEIIAETTGILFAFLHTGLWDSGCQNSTISSLCPALGRTPRCGLISNRPSTWSSQKTNQPGVLHRTTHRNSNSPGPQSSQPPDRWSPDLVVGLYRSANERAFTLSFSGDNPKRKHEPLAACSYLHLFLWESRLRFSLLCRIRGGRGWVIIRASLPIRKQGFGFLILGALSLPANLPPHSCHSARLCSIF